MLKIQQNQSGLNANRCRLKAASKRHNGLSDILRGYQSGPSPREDRETLASLASRKLFLRAQAFEFHSIIQ